MWIPPIYLAYIDPGTGALLWQLLAGAALGALFYVRRFTAWIRRVLRPHGRGGSKE